MSNENDAVLVNRNGNTYQTTVEKMAELQDNDLVLVNREGTTYTITGEEIRESITNEIAPNITSVVLEQDQTNGDRYTSNSFTSRVNYSEDPFPPASVEMVAKVEGVLGLDAGTSSIVQNNYPGTTSTEVELQLTNTQFIDDGVFEVGDEVKANVGYTPETSDINTVRTSQYDSSFGTSGTIDISALPGGEVFTIISVGPGFKGGKGNTSRGSTEPRGGAGAAGGGAGPLYYRTFTREEYIAEFGNTYTQSTANNFAGSLGYAGGSNAPDSTSYCGACIGPTGPSYPIDQAILDELNEALGGAMVLSKGAGGSPGGTKNNNSHSGGSGGGGAGGLSVTSTSSIVVPTIPKGQDGFESTDGRGGYGGKGGTGFGAGGGGGGGDGDNSGVDMRGEGGVGQEGINIVSIGNGQTIITFTDDKDIELFQEDDVVQKQPVYSTEGRQVYYVNGIVNGRQFKKPPTNPEAPFEGNSGSRCVAATPNEENGIGMVWPEPTNFGGSFIKIKLATNDTMRFVVNEDWDTPIPTDGPYPNGVIFEGDDTFDISQFVAARGGLLASVYVYSTTGTMAVNGFNNGSGWVSQTWAELTLTDVKVVSTSVADKRINVDGGNWDASNRSQAWSQGSTVGSDPKAAFDGDTTTRALPADPPDGIYPYSEGYTFTEIPVNSSLELWVGTGNNANNAGLEINGADVTSQIGSIDKTGRWVTITGFATLYSIDLIRTGPSDYNSLYAVKVDGRMLIDAVNDSQVWSDLTSYTAGDEDPTRGTLHLFDGDYDTYCYISGDEVVVTDFSSLPGGGLTVSDSVEFYIESASGQGQLTANGGATTGLTSATGWQSLPNPPALLTSLTFTGPIGGDSWNPSVLKIDGELLIDTRRS